MFSQLLGQVLGLEVRAGSVFAFPVFTLSRGSRKLAAPRGARLAAMLPASPAPLRRIARSLPMLKTYGVPVLLAALGTVLGLFAFRKFGGGAPTPA